MPMEAKLDNIEYLEDVFCSAEAQFATSGSNYIDATSFKTYFHAFNTIGVRLFSHQWTDREFFANKVSNQCEEFKAARKVTYKIFHDEKEMEKAYSRANAVNSYLHGSLRNGSLTASYLNYVSGEIIVLAKEFWGRLESVNARNFGRIRLPANKDNRAIPGTDYIIIIPIQELKALLKKLPKNQKKARLRPSMAMRKNAIKTLEKACQIDGAILNINTFCAALNHLLDTDYYKASGSRAYWKDFPYRQGQGIKTGKFLQYEFLVPFVDKTLE